jgi:hypothetical protein
MYATVRRYEGIDKVRSEEIITARPVIACEAIGEAVANGVAALA